MDEKVLRKSLAVLLAGRGAHVTLEQALADVPREIRTVVPEGFAHSIWQVVEHVRIAQEDILRYALEPDWISPAWPEGYWPSQVPAEVGDESWERSLAAIRRDLEATIELVGDPAIELTAQVPHGEPGHTYLREVLLVADHNAYHAGQIVDLRRALGAWPAA